MVLIIWSKADLYQASDADALRPCQMGTSLVSLAAKALMHHDFGIAWKAPLALRLVEAHQEKVVWGPMLWNRRENLASRVAAE
jgi:hypothetical protein